MVESFCFNPCFGGTIKSNGKEKIYCCIVTRFQSLFWWNYKVKQDMLRREGASPLAFQSLFWWNYKVKRIGKAAGGVTDVGFNPCFGGTIKSNSISIAL